MTLRFVKFNINIMGLKYHKCMMIEACEQCPHDQDIMYGKKTSGMSTREALG